MRSTPKATEPRARPGLGLAAALAALVAASGCEPARMAPPLGEHREGAEPTRGGVLRGATFVDVRALDPAVAFDEGSAFIESLVFDGLVDYDASGALVPRLAERFAVSRDGRRVDFRLREGVRMHDGALLEASDVKRSLERTLAHDTPCPAPSFYASIAGYAEFHDGTRDASGARVFAPELRGVVVDGPLDLHVDLAEPDATFLPVMTLAFAAPVCRDAGRAYDRAWQRRPCGAGPFELVAWEPAREIRLARHEGYWQPGKPYLDGVHWSLLVPPLTQRFELERGELDRVRELSLPDSIAYRRDPAWRPFGSWEPTRDVRGVFLNTRTPPFDAVEVRRAVAAAIDWDEIAALNEGHVVRTRRLVPSAIADPRDFEGQRHDVAAALEHMKNAGFAFDPSTGRGGYPGVVRHLSVSESFDVSAAQLISQQLARIGLRTELRVVSWPTYLAETGRPGRAQMGFGGWVADFPDASDFFEPLLSTAAIQDEESQNASFFSNAELDATLARAHREVDAEARRALYLRAEAIVRDEAPWAIGYASRDYRLAQPWLHGWRAGAVRADDVRDAWIDVEARAHHATLRPGRRDVLAMLRGFGRPR